MVDKKHLEEILRKLPQSRVFVLGDLMWDEYIRGDVSRISPEAPVPVLLGTSEDRTPGGAANVLKNLRDLKDKAEALNFLPKVVSMIDKLAKRGNIHRNKASNLKSGLMRHVNALAS